MDFVSLYRKTSSFLIKNYNYILNNINNFIKYICITLFVGFVYIFFALLGMKYAIPPGNVSSIFPSSGFAVGFLLTYGWKRPILGIFLGSFIVNIILFNNIFFGISAKEIICSFSIGLGSLLQAGILYYFIQKYIKKSFNHLFDVFKFAAITLLCCLIASTGGVLSLCGSGFVIWKDFFYTWITWLLGDAAGILLITPMFITFKDTIFKHLTIEKFLESILLFLTIFLFSEIIFGINGKIGYMLLFSISPIFVWAALRFGQFEVSLAFFITACISIINTAHNVGAFASIANNLSFLMLQYFIAILGLTNLVISTSVRELKDMKTNLEKAYSNIETEVKNRTLELKDSNDKLVDTIQEQEESRRKLEAINFENLRLRELTKQLNKE